MFENIGSKIKTLAKIIFWIEVAGAVIGGISVAGIDEEFILLAFLIWIAGPLLAWVSSWFVYGYGQLIENSDTLVALKTDELSNGNTDKSQAAKSAEKSMIEELPEL